MTLGRFVLLAVVLLTATGVVRAQPPGDTARIEEALGLRILPVPEDLRSHLPTLPPGAGYVIGLIMPNSRATDLGLRQYDVLVALGGERFKSEADLLHKLAVSEPTQKQPLHIIRHGFAKVLAPSGVATSPTGNEPAAYAPPKDMFKPGGRPAVSMETKRRPDGLLEVTVWFLNQQTSQMEKRKLTGTLETIERQINGLARAGLMAPTTHDLAAVAMHRLRTRAPGTASATAKQSKRGTTAVQP
jgi:hypothetical protein